MVLAGEGLTAAAPLLVLGATGMLGQAVMAAGLARRLPLIGAARSGSDIDIDLEDIESLVRQIADIRPAVIINAAALTNLGACERSPETAYRVNARCVATLAEAARSCQAWLVQVSTDHYFSGDGCLAHREDAPIRLFNEYARTKYAGECFALTNPGGLVLRTNIVGYRGRGAPTFVEWILAELGRGNAIPGFDDYFISSMTARQLATVLFDLIGLRPRGILNVAARDVFSKRAFIEAIRTNMLAGAGTTEPASVNSLSSARRAESLGLDVSRVELLLGRRMPTLAEVVADLAAEHEERMACATTA